jgi:hypothetical protein
VQLQACVAGTHIAIVGFDLKGVMRIRIELARGDASGWLIKVVRHWLAWRYGAAEIRLLG